MAQPSAFLLLLKQTWLGLSDWVGLSGAITEQAALRGLPLLGSPYEKLIEWNPSEATMNININCVCVHKCMYSAYSICI